MSEILDIGKHCDYCRQLDFLPFVCDACKQVFCASHRTQLEHHCPVAVTKEFTASPSSSPGKGLVAALFPDRSQDKARLEKSLNAPKKPVTIKETQFRVGDAAANKPNAFMKLKLLFGSQKKKPETTGRARTVEVLQLRKSAQGDAKIKIADRVHLWCLYVDAHGDLVATKQIDEKKERRAVWVSKQWPVGRALDALSETLRLKNVNNSSSDSLQRLGVYTMVDGEPRAIATSERCTKFKDGDTIYLVRGG